MQKVIRVLTSPVVLRNTRYTVEAHGDRCGGEWQGWLEFSSVDDGRWRSPRQTIQPNRAALCAWAAGLSQRDLECAHRRAVRVTTSTPAGPPSRSSARTSSFRLAVDVSAADRVAVNPYVLWAKDQQLLHEELTALTPWHLRQIVRAYGMSQADVDSDTSTREELVSLITEAVRTGSRS